MNSALFQNRAESGWKKESGHSPECMLFAALFLCRFKRVYYNRPHAAAAGVDGFITF
jgi:hypothetical protein